jgi:hypothetical protein
VAPTSLILAILVGDTTQSRYGMDMRLGIRVSKSLPPRVLEALCDEVRAGVDGDKLLAHVRLILYERRYVISAPRTVGEPAKRGLQKGEHEVIVAIEQTIRRLQRHAQMTAVFIGATLIMSSRQQREEE